MASLRTHDVVLAEGTFRVVLTEKRRVLAVARRAYDGARAACTSCSRSIARRTSPKGVSPLVLTQPPTVETAGLDLGDIGNAVSHAAEGAFNAVSHAATTIARPAFDARQGGVERGRAPPRAHGPVPAGQANGESSTPLRASSCARSSATSTAKQFIRGIADAAKAGEHAATHIGDTLLDASKVVSHIAELPLVPLEHVPGIGPFVKCRFAVPDVGPHRGRDQEWRPEAARVHRETAALDGSRRRLARPRRRNGDLRGDLGGPRRARRRRPARVAIRTAYGAIPIPPGIRQVTDTVLDTVLNLAFHHEIAHGRRRQRRSRPSPRGLPRRRLRHADQHRRAAQARSRRSPAASSITSSSSTRRRAWGSTCRRPSPAAVSHLPNVFAALPPGLRAGIRPLPHLPALPRARRPRCRTPRTWRCRARLPASPRMVQPLRTAHA